VWELVTERAARWRQEHARPANERLNAERQIKRLEAKITNRVGLVAKGRPLPDVEKGISERRGQADALKLKLAAPVDIDLDRKSLHAELRRIRSFRSGDRIIDDPKSDFVVYGPSRATGSLANAQDPVGVRSALPKVGVQRIIVKPVEGGWEFEGVADLGRLINNKGKSEGAVEAPSDSTNDPGTS